MSRASWRILAIAICAVLVVFALGSIVLEGKQRRLCVAAGGHMVLVENKRVCAEVKVLRL